MDQTVTDSAVNPYEAGRVADYLHHALTMSTAEAEVGLACN